MIENSPYRDSLLQKAGIEKGKPVPERPAGLLIKHVVLLMKENRTYDQVLGDMKEATADPNLVLFGETVTPNHHKLAREFVLPNNFYVNADVSADGYYWTTAAIDPDSNQKTWPMSYAGRRYPPLGGPNMFSTVEKTPEGILQTPGGFIGTRLPKPASPSITTASALLTCRIRPIPECRSNLFATQCLSPTPITTSASTIAASPTSSAYRSFSTISQNGKRKAICRASL